MGIAFFVFAIDFVNADGGHLPPNPDVDIYEPGQKAIIGWNGREEVMLLSIDVRGTEDTDVLWIIPLPSKPTIEEGNFTSFYRIAKYFNDHQPRLRPLHGKRNAKKTLSLGKQGVNIVFHDKIGAHDITVIKAFDLYTCVSWIRGYLTGYGASVEDYEERLVPVINHYLSNGIRYFVFDKIKVYSNVKSVKPLIYHFRSRVLYYPMTISSLNSGRTTVTLFLIGNEDAVFSSSFSAKGFYKVGEPVRIVKKVLEEICPGFSDLFREEMLCLSVWRYSGYLSLDSEDVMIPYISKPFVRIIEPKSGESVREIVTVRGSFSEVVKKIWVRIDRGEWHEAEVFRIGHTFLPLGGIPRVYYTGGVWRYKWDTMVFQNGLHRITVKAFDGERYEYVSVYVSVSNILSHSSYRITVYGFVGVKGLSHPVFPFSTWKFIPIEGATVRVNDVKVTTGSDGYYKVTIEIPSYSQYPFPTLRIVVFKPGYTLIKREIFLFHAAEHIKIDFYLNKIILL